MIDFTWWSRDEVEAAVADYFHMLTLELSGQGYNKSAHRRALAGRLRARSEGSIERKHQNISAVMIDLGCPYIMGYKPLGNYQSLLYDVIAERVSGDRLFDQAAIAAAEQPAAPILEPTFDSLLTDVPVAPAAGVQEERADYQSGSRGIIRDYLAREARNRSLGLAGEKLVVAYEKHRLASAGKQALSDRVEHVAATRGDGLGFDVLSFDVHGRERFIEVKTTAFGQETPFYLSRKELLLSKEQGTPFHLYRVFAFRQRPRMFGLQGPVDRHCRLDPMTYLARL